MVWGGGVGRGWGEDLSFPECVDSVVNTCNLTPLKRAAWLDSWQIHTSPQAMFFSFRFYHIVSVRQKFGRESVCLRRPNLPPPPPPLPPRHSPLFHSSSTLAHLTPEHNLMSDTQSTLKRILGSGYGTSNMTARASAR